MFSNVALNAFCQSTFDESFVVDEIGVPSIDENDIKKTQARNSLLLFLAFLLWKK